MLSPTRIAAASPLDSANIEGPDPEIPLPSAPESVAAFFNPGKPGIKADRCGSITTSTSDLQIKS